jgi:hypothetical protein
MLYTNQITKLEKNIFFGNLRRRKMDELDPYGSLIKIEKKYFFQVLKSIFLNRAVFSDSAS